MVAAGLVRCLFPTGKVSLHIADDQFCEAILSRLGKGSIARKGIKVSFGPDGGWVRLFAKL